jgi:hypothetical protein
MAIPTATDRATRSVRRFEEAERTRQATIRAGVAESGKLAGQAALFGAVATGMADDMGVANAATGALIGSLGGPWVAALGAAVGLALDTAAANDDLAASFEAVDRSLQTKNLDTAASQLDAAAKKVDDFRDKIEQPGAFELNFLEDIERGWNTIEGLFGTSNVEEAEAELERLGKAYRDALAEADAERVRDSNIARLRDEFDAATESAEDFAAALAEVNSYLEGRASLRDYQAALDDFTQSIKDNGKSFDITTEKGRNNQAALDGIASTALKVAENMTGMRRVRFLEGAAEQIAAFGRQMGIPRREIRRLINELLYAGEIKARPEVKPQGVESARRQVLSLIRSYGLTPKEIKTLVNQPNMPAAKQQIDQLRTKYNLTPNQVRTLIALAGAAQANAAINGVDANLRGLDGNTAVVTILTRRITEISRRIGHTLGFNADGNIIDYYAAGGMREAHVAQIAPAGSWRVWAEPETGGEAYIPLAPSKRDRSVAIWEETGRRLGVEFVKMANGALLAERYAMNGAGGRTGRLSITVEGRLTGTVRTPWGEAPIEGLVRQVAREEIDADRDFEMRGRPR